MNELQIKLRLQKIHHLFETPDISPYSEHYEPYSNKAGINYVIEELYVHRKSKKILLTIVLPSNQLTPDLEQKTVAAIKRYSKAWALDAKQKMSRANYKGLRSLATAVVALIFLNGTGIWLGNFDNFIIKLISEGLIVAAWVLMWFPLDILTQEFWINRLERKSFQKLENIRIEIKTEALDGF